jgi:hypothetical protein
VRERRNLWATPPGGIDPQTRKAARARLRIGVVSALSSLLAVGGAGVYATMKASTPAAVEDALAEFRAERSTRTGDGKRERSRQPRESRRPPSKKERSPDRRATVAASGDESFVRVQRSNRSSAKPKRARTSAPALPVGRPREGVYSWEIEGYEQVPGVKRDLPKRSHRVITHQGRSDWTEHHIFSEQREQWLKLEVSREGVATTSARNRVEMGPVEVDRTVIFNPPVFVARFPFDLGAVWKGSWSGKTRGKYTARTFDHSTLTIGGERVEVWATEVVMDMTGEVEGRVITRSWVAPKYRLVVKQYQWTQVESGPGEYRSEWTGKLRSLHPHT